MFKSRLLLAVALFAATGSSLVAANPSEPKTEESKDKGAKGIFASGSNSKRRILGGVMVASVILKLMRGASRIKASQMAALDAQATDRAVTEEEYKAAENYLQALFSQKNMDQAWGDFKRGLMGTGEIFDVATSLGIVVPAGFLIHDFWSQKEDKSSNKK